MPCFWAFYLTIIFLNIWILLNITQKIASLIHIGKAIQ